MTARRPRTGRPMVTARAKRKTHLLLLDGPDKCLTPCHAVGAMRPVASHVIRSTGLFQTSCRNQPSLFSTPCPAIMGERRATRPPPCREYNGAKGSDAGWQRLSQLAIQVNGQRMTKTGRCGSSSRQAAAAKGPVTAKFQISNRPTPRRERREGEGEERKQSASRLAQPPGPMINDLRTTNRNRTFSDQPPPPFGDAEGRRGNWDTSRPLVRPKIAGGEGSNIELADWLAPTCPEGWRAAQRIGPLQIDHRRKCAGNGAARLVGFKWARLK